eukprot:CAMPEP_0205938234 /NCGR_PEP_ID=MMETSP1325-20131115/46439_1 /ASSEMBLY_ACC=CAM_ASM_000708 /TAXON_ID=236786 /ORGANISM="Florenciella sp., Strain RCC1007" /LENGTH=35 /DNA_ID= /DNA_START= /DNA_END= /DNA_ORIENTATION=
MASKAFEGDAYKVLGVVEEATELQIKSAFRHAATR